LSFLGPRFTSPTYIPPPVLRSRSNDVKNQLELPDKTHAVSRRRFFTTAASTASGAALLTSLAPATAWADEQVSDCGLLGICDFPEPIPHVAAPGLHFFFPGPVEGAATDVGHDPSLIFNFNGFVGNANFPTILGTGIDLSTGATAPYTFHADMRFMKGVFVGSDGVNRHGAFVFI
jgi:hypothetical protein